MNIHAGMRVSSAEWREQRTRVAVPAAAAPIEPRSDEPMVQSPPRFPWLSWYSRSVERATRRGSAFEDAAVVGTAFDRFV